ncbi:hypothetical protein PQX77_007245 [Marasmius sp. AFHP31]|nr:hypothetical protein PQX77_007245 [Marasmius sp. AFHP31]
MSTIPRSKSAPQPLPALRSFATTPAHLPRSASHQTIQPKAKSASTGSLRPIHRGVVSPRTEREDPFNLTGFYPTGSMGGTSHGDASWWLPETEEEGEKHEETPVNTEERTWSFGGEDAGPNRTAGQMSDEMTREAITSEDKMGILSFGG